MGVTYSREDVSEQTTDGQTDYPAFCPEDLILDEISSTYSDVTMCLYQPVVLITRHLLNLK